MYKNKLRVPNLKLLNIKGCTIAGIGPDFLKKV